MTCPSVGFRTMRIHGSPVAMTAAAIAAPIMTRGTSRLVALRERTMIGSAGGTQVESDSDGVVTECARVTASSLPCAREGAQAPTSLVDETRPPLGDDASSSARRSNKASRFPVRSAGCRSVAHRTARRCLPEEAATRIRPGGSSGSCESSVRSSLSDDALADRRGQTQLQIFTSSLVPRRKRPPQRMVTETPSTGQQPRRRSRWAHRPQTTRSRSPPCDRRRPRRAARPSLRIVADVHELGATPHLDGLGEVLAIRPQPAGAIARGMAAHLEAGAALRPDARVTPLARGHLGRVTEEVRSRLRRWCVDVAGELAEDVRGRAVQGRHRGDRMRARRVRSGPILDCRADDAGAERFGEHRASPGRAPALAQKRSGLIAPVTAYRTSLPGRGRCGRRARRRPPPGACRGRQENRRMVSTSSTSSGNPAIARAVTGVPPMAYRSVSELAAAIWPYVNGSSTIGVKKSTVWTSAGPPPPPVNTGIVRGPEVDQHRGSVWGGRSLNT